MLDSTSLSWEVALGAGLVSFFSPCVVVLLPAWLSFLAGVTPAGGGRARRLFLSALFFSAGFAVIFVGLGASFGGLSTWLHQVSGWIERVGGAVIIFLGLMLVGAIKLPWLSRSHQWRVTAPAGAGTARRLFFAFLGGLIFGVGWTPCLGPVLAAILVLAGQGGSVAAGAQLLFIYTLGLMVPLLVISLGIDTAQKFLSRGAKWFNIVNKLAGTILVIVGVILLLGVWPKLLGALFSLIA